MAENPIQQSIRELEKIIEMQESDIKNLQMSIKWMTSNGDDWGTVVHYSTESRPCASQSQLRTGGPNWVSNLLHYFFIKNETDQEVEARLEETRRFNTRELKRLMNLEAETKLRLMEVARQRQLQAELNMFEKWQEAEMAREGQRRRQVEAERQQQARRQYQEAENDNVVRMYNYC